MRKNVFAILALLLLFTSVDFVFAQPEQVEISFFYSKTCPHCVQEKRFLEKLENKYNKLLIHKYNIAEQDRVEMLKGFYEKYGVPKEEWGFVPATFLKDKYLIGYRGDEITGKEIEDCIQECLTGADSVGTDWMEASLKEINLPVFGKINVSNLSPLLLSITMGALDGFNACAMVALGFLLTVLISSGTRKRLALIGGTFILVSGLIYFLFIAAWLNLFLVTFNIKIITNLVAVIVILSGIFVLRDYFTDVVCKLCETDPAKQNIFTRVQKKLFTKMQKFSATDMPLPLALLGISIVAAGVNMIELACSFGLPLVFTKILTSWSLPKASYYFYLLVYILFYMIDDFIIFLIAVYTFKMTQASTKYLKAATLISGLILLVLGILMLINPSILILS